jgi:hypothetical protein
MLPADWPEHIAEIEKTTKMFACTVKAVHHDILSRGDFDLAVVIDVHKLPDAALWGVLLRARQVLLVGTAAQSEESGDLYLFQRLLGQGTVPVVRWTQPPKLEPDTVVILDDDEQ